MAAAIDRLASEGWQAEGSAEYGFVFIRRGDDRRLLMLTERDPQDTRAQFLAVQPASLTMPELFNGCGRRLSIYCAAPRGPKDRM